MDRQIVYPAQQPRSLDFLTSERSTMITFGHLARTVLGTSTLVDGLACTQTTVASMQVVVAPGCITSLGVVDGSAYGGLTADGNALVRVGTNEGSTSFTLTAPVSAGQSINYLIEGQFFEADTNATSLTFRDASTGLPYTATQNTTRKQSVALQVKAGTAATTGSQTTPSVDSGWTGLYVVTVAYGATTVVNANISVYPGAPFLSAKLPDLPTGRLLRTVKLGVGSGTYTAGTDAKAIRVRMVGGGGGGGGAAITAASGTSTGAPGSAGAYLESYHTTGFAGGIAYVVGAKGTGGTGAAGNDGHDTTLAISGGTLTAGKGFGGGVSAAALIPLSGGNGTPSSASGGTLVNAPGDAGGQSMSINGSCAYGGAGGRSFFGAGAPASSGNANGAAGSAPGSGGAGTANYNNGSAATTGGNGADGLIIIEEFG